MRNRQISVLTVTTTFALLFFLVVFYKICLDDSKIAIIEKCNLPEHYALKIQLDYKRISFQFDNNAKSIFISKSQGFLVPSGFGDFVKSRNYKTFSQTTCYSEKSEFCSYISILRKYGVSKNDYNGIISKDKFEVTFYTEKLGGATCSSDVMQKTYREIATLDEISPEFESMIFQIVDRKEFYSFFKTGQK